ncbi:uncharacterized protein LOC142468194 isoform X2 [Ascaphus truei]|uniref:uncharacterized protein LOC142468194 isoform X2 n=1 Tax=Ascaphus truei TaxID=8439 RepID=UPI003F597E9C
MDAITSTSVPDMGTLYKRSSPQTRQDRKAEVGIRKHRPKDARSRPCHSSSGLTNKLILGFWTEQNKADGSMSRNTPAGCHTPLCSPDCVNEDNTVITQDQGENCLRQNKPSKGQRKYVTIMAQESTSCDEGNLTASHIYTLRKHTGTEYAATHIECDEGNANAQKIHQILSVMKYESSDCDKNFNSETDYTIHQRKHTTVRRHKCSECHKCFASKTYLVRHQIMHTGEKPFVCSECGKCFTFNSNLFQHQAIHSGEKPCVCSECGKCFTRKSNLVTHQRIHSGEKPFVCSECGKCFTQSSHLVKHQRLHTEEKHVSLSD